MKLANGLLRAGQVVFGSGLASAFILSSNIVLARALTPTAYGDYITAFTLTNGGMFIAVFGITQLLLQEYGRKRFYGKSFVRSVLTVQLAATALSCIGIVAIVFVLHLSYEARILTLLLLPILVAQAAGDISSVYFQLTQQRWLTGGWIAILNFLRFAAALLFVLSSRSIYMLPLYQSFFGTIFTIASVYLILRMFTIYSPVHDDEIPFWRGIKTILADAGPYAISSLMYFSVAQLPLVLFALIAGSQQVANYGVAFLIISTFYFVPQTLMTRYLLLKYHTIATADRKSLNRLYRDGSGLAFAAGLALALPAFFLIPALIHLLFGTKYDESIHLVRIMLICIPLRFLTVNLSAIVVSGVSIWHKNFADLASGGFAVICYLLLIFLDPRVGGAYAAVLTEVVMLSAHYYVIERYLYRRNFRQWLRHSFFLN